MGLRTDNITGEKGIDPAHDQTLRNHHGNIALHHAHHSLHHGGISHRVGSGLSTHVWFGEERSFPVCFDEIAPARGERSRQELVEVVAQVDTAHERARLAKVGECLWFRCRLEEC